MSAFSASHYSYSYEGKTTSQRKETYLQQLRLQLQRPRTNLQATTAALGSICKSTRLFLALVALLLQSGRNVRNCLKPIAGQQSDIRLAHAQSCTRTQCEASEPARAISMLGFARNQVAAAPLAASSSWNLSAQPASWARQPATDRLFYLAASSWSRTTSAAISLILAFVGTAR